MTIEIFDDNISQELINEVRKFDVEGISDYLNDSFTFTTGIVTSRGRMVAIGIIRVVNELKVIVRPEISNIHKAAALRLLLNESKSKMQCNEAFALITNGGDHYINILKNHYRFREDYGVFLRLDREV